VTAEPRALSPSRLAWRVFLRNRTAVAGMAAVAGFLLLSVAGVLLTAGNHPILDPREVRLPDKLKPPPNPNLPIGLHPEVTRGEAIVGGWVGVVLHEAGHAVFDIQKIPRFGKEEDAADQIAAFMMLQFGTDVARVMVKGTYNLWRHMYGMSGGHQAGHYAGVHSIGAQRGANYLCIAYGGEPAALKDLADLWLSDARKENCANEFKQVQLAFRKTFLQYVDEAQMAKVRRMAILRPEDITR